MTELTPPRIEKINDKCYHVIRESDGKVIGTIDKLNTQPKWVLRNMHGGIMLMGTKHQCKMATRHR